MSWNSGDHESARAPTRIGQAEGGMKQAKHFGMVGAALGFCVALILTALAYYLNSHRIVYHLDTLYLVLAPTSLVLMLTEHATPSAQVMVILIFALSNSVLYAIVFSLIGLICAAAKSN